MEGTLYLNSLLTSQEDRTYPPIFKIIEKPNSRDIDFTARFLNFSELIKFIKSGNYKIDWDIDSGHLVWDGHSQSLSTELLDTLEGNYISVKKTSLALYDLLMHLVDTHSQLLDTDIELLRNSTEFFDFISKGYQLANFYNMKISNSSMRIYFTLLRENTFYTRNIVSNIEGLESESFNFFTKEPIPEHLENMVDLVARHSKEGSDIYYIYTLNKGVSLSVNINRKDVFPGNYISHMNFERERLSRTVRLINDYEAELKEAMGLDTLDTEEVEYSHGERSTGKSVNFELLSVPKFKKSDRKMLIESLILYTSDLREGYKTLDDIKLEIDRLNINPLNKTGYMTLITIIDKYKNNPEVLLNGILQTERFVKKRLLSNSLLLYQFRVLILTDGIVFNKSPLSEEDKFLKCGMAATTTFVALK